VYHEKEMIDNTDFNNIKQWLLPKLEERGLTVEELANKIGVTRAAVYFWLNDTTRPSESAMKRICDLLGLPFEEGLAQYTPKRVGRPKERVA
jgi:transcriptional regulator with XRE-family HTH domain